MENFEVMKNAWDRMGQAERIKFAEQHKDNANFQQFAKQYSQWATPPQQTSTPAPTAPQPSNPAPVGNNQQNQTPANGQNWGNGGGNQQSSPQPSYDPNEQFDSSGFNNPNAQVKVQAGNANQTWMPDYQDDSDARMNEITNNLNAYWNTNREYFSDRQTFNKVFSYDKRSKAQQAHFDSFWKRKEIDKKVAGYTDWKSVSLALEEGTLTKAQLEALKVQNPKVYAEYLEDQLNKKNLDLVNIGSKSRIFNEDEQISHNTDALTDMMRKLGFDMSADGRARELYDKFKELKTDPKIDTMKKDYLEARRIYLQRRREFNTLPERIRAQSSGVSETLISARISKAQRLAYNELQTLADEAQIRKEEYVLEYGEMKDEFNAFKMQADEDYRAFTSKMSSLWFAKGLLSFETPEQQRQAQIRQLKEQNKINLEYQEQQTLLKNKLQNQISDISVKDPEQLRANLSNALNSYYENYGSLIMRSKDQVVDDILRYAKEKGVSVAQAMSENFIKPLQNKPQYRSLINKQTGYDPTSWQQKWRITQDGDGKVKIQMEWTGQIPKNFTRQQRVQSYSNWLSQANTLEDVGSIVSSFQDGAKWGQCGAFANDIAKAMWSNVHFGGKLSEKTNPTWNYTKSEVPQVGSFAIFNSKNYPANGHVGVVTKVNADGSFVMKSSNRGWDERIYTSNHAQGSALTFIVPNVNRSNNSTYDPELEEYYKKLQSWKTITKEDWKTIESKTTRNWFLGQARTYKQTKDQEIAPFAKELIGQLQELKRMDSWDFKNVWLWGIPWTKWAYYKSLYDRILSSTALHNLIDLKWQGATFWALSNQELEFITNASTNLKLKLGYGDFMDIVDQMISKLNKGITTAWWNGGVDMNLSDQGGRNQTLFSDMMRK